jgi:hypothetical protein
VYNCIKEKAMTEQSNTEKLVENVINYCEILESFPIAAIQGMIPSISQLAEEVSIVDAERQRLQEENEKLRLLAEANAMLKEEIERLMQEIVILNAEVNVLTENNRSQAIMLKNDYPTMYSDDYKKYKKSKHYIKDWENTHYAMKA